MSKIKTLLPEDYETDSRGDVMSMIAQERYELEQANRQWELSKFTDKEINDEYIRRLLLPLTEANERLQAFIDKLDEHKAPF